MPKTQITLGDSFEMTFKNKCDENFMKWKKGKRQQNALLHGVLRLPRKPIFTFYFVQERMKGKEPIIIHDASILLKTM